jgi:hypothetical protein
MHRRTFVGVLGGMGLAAAATDAAKRTRFYLFEQFKLKQGSQLPRLHDYISQSMLPAMNRIHAGPKIFLESLVTPHSPQLLAVYGFSSLEEMWSVHTKTMADETLLKKFEALESGPEPAFESIDSTLIEATGYSPEIKPEASASPRIFEWRVYHSPTFRQLGALHERFRGPEMKIFHRAGIHPVLYGSTVIGQNLPNLTYLMPFADLAAREKAWSAFAADADWPKVRQESIDKSGQIVAMSQISLYKATPYSPVR